MRIFLNKLKEEIQAKLKASELRTLSKLMDRALELGERHMAWRNGNVVIASKSGGEGSKGLIPFRPLLMAKVGGLQRVTGGGRNK